MSNRIREVRGVPLGEYPCPDPDPTTEAKVVYRTPRDFILKGSNQLITVQKGNGDDQFILTFWTWCQDSRFKTAVKGTWYSEEVFLSKKQLHALQRMDLGGL
jgi:hypothetical protein